MVLQDWLMWFFKRLELQIIRQQKRITEKYREGITAETTTP